jgi:hypothetical protein
VHTVIAGIVDSLMLLTIALLLISGLIAIRRMAGRTPSAMPVRVIARHRPAHARVRPTAFETAGLSLRAPPTLPAQRRRVYPGYSRPS